MDLKENCKNCLNKNTDLCEIRKCIDNTYKCVNKKNSIKDYMIKDLKTKTTKADKIILRRLENA